MFRLDCLALALLGPLYVGCATHSTSIDGPGRSAGDGYQWPPRSDYGAESHQGTTERAPVGAGRSTRVQAKTIAEPDTDYSAPKPYHSTTGTPEPTQAPMMGEKPCLAEARKRGIQFKKLDSLKGVEVPIEVEGKLGGVEFWTDGGRSLQMDCRLALALDSMEPIFRSHGLIRARYSGAYVYKTTRSGRLSHHAHGLAIDLHSFTFTEEAVEVEGGFARNVGCKPGNAALNRMSCEMRGSKVWDEFLTPDYNYDHRNHLHISVPRRQ